MHSVYAVSIEPQELLGRVYTIKAHNIVDPVNDIYWVGKSGRLPLKVGKMKLGSYSINQMTKGILIGCRFIELKRNQSRELEPRDRRRIVAFQNILLCMHNISKEERQGIFESLS